MSSWCCAEAFSGYVAAIVWRSVHVERPSCSTSGGQSAGNSVGCGVDLAAVAGIDCVAEDVEESVLEEEEDCWACFVSARHEATEVQVRQLCREERKKLTHEFALPLAHEMIAYEGLDSNRGGKRRDTYGLPSLSRTTPLGKGALESVPCDSSVDLGSAWLKACDCALNCSGCASVILWEFLNGRLGSDGGRRGNAVKKQYMSRSAGG